MEIVHPSPSQTVILDVAHNPDGFSNLLKSIRKQFPDQPLKAVCGLSKTKDIPCCLRILKPHLSHFYPVTAPNGRGISTLELYRHLIALDIPIAAITVQPTISGVIDCALKENSPGLLLICGSFFIMSEARKALGIKEPCDSLNLNESGQNAQGHSEDRNPQKMQMACQPAAKFWIVNNTRDTT
jgi:dihydrofolate synthase/folylpolyglutamate synthase